MLQILLNIDQITVARLGNIWAEYYLLIRRCEAMGISIPPKSGNRLSTSLPLDRLEVRSKSSSRGVREVESRCDVWPTSSQIHVFGVLDDSSTSSSVLSFSELYPLVPFDPFSHTSL